MKNHMRQATLAGIRCLAMMEETTEQLERKDGSIEDLTSWTGECRVPGPYADRILQAAIAARPLSYRGPLRREGGHIEMVEGEVIAQPVNPAGAAGAGRLAGLFEEEAPDPDRFKLTGSGSPTVIANE